MSSKINEAFRNVEGISHLYLDIGSKSIKIAYLSSVPVNRTTLDFTIEKTEKTFERLHCLQVKNEDFEEVLDFFAKNVELKTDFVHYAQTTTADAMKNLIESKLRKKMICHDPFDCITAGTTFLLSNIEAESYTYSFEKNEEYEFNTLNQHNVYPYLLVNIRTGVSIILVEDKKSFTRIGGTSIGGGAFLGLSSLLTGENDLEILMQMAENGNASVVDKHISDVYGNKANNLGLPGNLLAASFAKVFPFHGNIDPANRSDSLKRDMVSSLLKMIIFNIAHLAHLYCSDKVTRVFFNGFLVRNRPVVMKNISYAFNFWTQGQRRAFFLRHENYTQCIGVFCNSMSRKFESKSDAKLDYRWKEHYSGSTALGRFVPTTPLTVGFEAQTFELDYLGFSGDMMYLLNDDEQKPDFANLNKDQAAREFWINVMEETIPGIRKIAIGSQEKVKDKNDLFLRADGFSKTFKHMLNIIHENHFAYGNANARNLLELREQILNEYGFDDIFLQRKQNENIFALKELPKVLKKIDFLKTKLSEKEHFEYVCRGLLAGNVFDWGAKEVVKIMESPNGLKFSDAVEKVEPRPWLFDDFDIFYENLPKYKSALIFVDNSGCDFILGVLPFVRELVLRGSRVIICANSSPALNDLTYKEMLTLLKDIRKCDEELKQFINKGLLMFTQSGQSSPCLDLRNVHNDLNYMVLRNRVDLMIMEGMGRALHTNFSLTFRCDCLKVAVIKTQWLADRLGGKMFSVVFKFTPGNNFYQYPGCPSLDQRSTIQGAVDEDEILKNL